MQFGRLHGLLFVALGVLLLASQAWMSLTPSKAVERPPIEVTKPEHKMPPIAGVIGGLSLIGGVFIYVANRRRPS
jgi:uncharacterized membrane protein YfcA